MTEREWRETSDMRRASMTLAVIIAAAALLRFWGLGVGIPYAVGVDEPEIVTRAVQMMKSGDFNPHFYDYPGLYIYVQVVVATVGFLAGATAGTWTSLAQAEAEHFFLWGRAVTATLGTATVFVVFLVGMRWGTRYALLASALMAVMPLHVRESHYVLTDVPATFFVTLTFLLTLRAMESPRAAMCAWAGAAAGLAAATKYPAGLVLILPLMAVWMTPAMRPSRLLGALAVAGASLAAFLVAAPYTILDLPGFLNGYAKLAGSYTGPAPADPGWSTAFKHLRNALSWPGTLAVLGGIALASFRSVRGQARTRWMLALVFPLLYFWFVSRQSLIFGRYLLPMVPFLCILAAAAVLSGVSLLRRYDIPRAPRTGLVAALTIAVLLPPMLESIAWNRTNVKVSTVDLAYNWLKLNVPSDASVVVEARNLVLPGSIARTRNVGQLRFSTYEKYVADETDFMVASSQSYGPYLEAPHRFPYEYQDYMRLFGQSRELVRFTPDENHPGPELRIFKVRP